MIGRTYSDLQQTYRNLSILISAGISLPEAIRTIARGASAEDVRKSEVLAHRVTSGATFATAAASVQLPPLDRALIRIGETNGTLPETLLQLADYYETRAKIEKSFKSALVYPGFLFLISVFLRELPQLFSGQLNLFRYGLHAGVSILIASLIVVGVFRFFRAAAVSPKLAETYLSVAKRLPWIGPRLQSFGLERFFSSLAACFRAGSNLDLALDIAAGTVADPQIKSAAAQARTRQGRVGLTAALEMTRAFRPAHIAEVRTGEMTGELERAFARVAEDLRAENRDTLAIIQEMLPKVVYLVAALYVASGIISSFREITVPPGLS